MIGDCVIGDGMYRADKNEAGVFSHHLMRAALSAFECRFDQLSEEQQQVIEKTAQKAMAIESTVLSSREAWDVFLSEKVIDEAVESVRARYDSALDFEQDLLANGLDLQILRLALARELWVDAVLGKVVQDVPTPCDAEAKRWYDSHQERFLMPETRAVRHILITVNEALADNVRGKARLKIEAIRDQLDGSVPQFEQFAKQHSECPTALDGGRLGSVPRGKLYSLLDETLFMMDEGTLSGVLESEMGFHILLCEDIQHGHVVPFARVRQRIIDHLTAARCHGAQRQWIEGLAVS
ncbi:nitrogen fixation protein NifM [Cohaesibacter sp. CAU 1516]|uniref:nitrogen fixation protein NifM n=1 Tax=Cohaesibacter sp. CAU 1516 TaxID=2576038 RepID=UPI0010FE750D|nr:nitrogen fixation protein NifM [Cohaesibacter sp. CAU 1516]TLP44239.1 nitrogen fixation protein NifM [Cohaesibacter sp. CAU 1516]